MSIFILASAGTLGYQVGSWAQLSFCLCWSWSGSAVPPWPLLSTNTYQLRYVLSCNTQFQYLFLNFIFIYILSPPYWLLRPYVFPHKHFSASKTIWTWLMEVNSFISCDSKCHNNYMFLFGGDLFVLFFSEIEHLWRWRRSQRKEADTISSIFPADHHGKRRRGRTSATQGEPGPNQHLVGSTVLQKRDVLLMFVEEVKYSPNILYPGCACRPSCDAFKNWNNVCFSVYTVGIIEAL